MGQAFEISLDDSGQIVIPASLHGRLGLELGMTLVVEQTHQGDLRLRVQSEPPTLIDKGGVLVVQTDALGDLSNITRHERDQRVTDLAEQADL